MYKLLINDQKIDEFSSLITLIKAFIDTVVPGDNVEIWERKKTKWRLVDGAVYGVRL